MHILCVDDDSLVLAVTADLLRSLGHDVIEAKSASEAAATIADDTPFDILITDIHMPGGPDGLELSQYARKLRPRLPVIYFSGLQHVLPEGLHGQVLRKPCSLGELQRALSAFDEQANRSCAQ